MFSALMFFSGVGCLANANAVYAESGAGSAKKVLKDIKSQFEEHIKAPQSRDEKLDALFSKLNSEPDKGPAKRLSSLIWREWRQSGSGSINLLMVRVTSALALKRTAIAMDLLDQVVALAPNYAEGWNRRATVHFITKDFGKSIADIERTLALEPRHFGALAGLASILEQLGKDKEALKAWFKVLKIYPANETAQKRVILLTEKMFGERT